jgi:hypothetical protein
VPLWADGSDGENGGHGGSTYNNTTTYNPYTSTAIGGDGGDGGQRERLYVAKHDIEFDLPIEDGYHVVVYALHIVEGGIKYQINIYYLDVLLDDTQVFMR